MKKKRLLSILLSLAMVISVVPSLVISSVATDEELFTVSIIQPDNADAYAIITGCSTDAVGSVTVPSTYADVPVKHIGARAFEGCADITAVTLSENIEVINDYAFKDCVNLVSVTIPSSTSSLMSGLFDGCTNIKNIFFADTESLININTQIDWAPDTLWNLYIGRKLSVSLVVPEGVDSISRGLLNNCQSIKAISLPDGVKEIGSKAFSNCTGLVYITLPDTITDVCATSFSNTGYYNTAENWTDGILYMGKYLISAKNTTDTVTVKDGTVTLADSAFTDSKATNVTIPDSVKNINTAFKKCTSLKNVTIGKGAEVIPAGAFEGCISLAAAVLSAGTKHIESRAFADCSSLITINLPDTLESLDGALYNCNLLQSLHIPASLTDIDLSQFKHNSSLKGLSFDKNHPKYLTEGSAVYNRNKTELVFLPVNYSGIFEIPASVTSIADNAFRDCRSLTDIVLHDNVSDFGANAFSNTAYYNALLEASEDGNIYVGNYLIGTTTSDVIIKEGITHIADNAINSEDITSITLPVSLVQVGKNFYAPNLEKLNIKTLSSWLKVKYEDDSANILKACPDAKIWLNGICIETTIVPDDVDTIGSFKYSNNPQFDFAIIPETVTTIEPDAFYGCSERLIFRCYENSAAHHYAEENGIKYVFSKKRAADKTVIDTEKGEIITDEELIADPEEILPDDLGSLIASLGSTKIYSLEIYGTGSTLVIIINGVRYEFTLVVKGDVNGDGVCDALDAEILGHAIHGRKDLKDHHFRAMDTDTNNELSVEDYQEVINMVIE